MSDKDSSRRPDVEPRGVDYAFWDVPESPSPARVVYSIPLFHEIDFVVNEGYRKIPHGGIEVAGLLFGTVKNDEIRIEAFRPIECEHALGPSLNFSERDLKELETQIQASVLDRELEKLQPVGWFLGHTRGGLEMTDSELSQFDRFFPGPGKLTLIVKPERFQPTRFAFLVRHSSGEMPRDGSASAVILPLPGRAFKAGQVSPSIPAPKPAAVPKRRAPVPVPEEEIAAPAEPPRHPSESERDGKDDAVTVSARQQVEASLPEVRSFAQQQERRRLARERARLIEEAFPPPPPNAPQQARDESAEPPQISSDGQLNLSDIVLAPPESSAFLESSSVQPPFRPSPRTLAPPDATRFVPSAYDRLAAANQRTTEEIDDSGSTLRARTVTALALAALLGCLVGYFAYLQLPAPVIPIDVRQLNQTIVVSWPPEETRNASFATIRLDDGPQVELSGQEKTRGQVALSAAKDFKVEITARNWARDSRGIIRYLHSAGASGQVVAPSVPPTLPNDAPPPAP